ncbi:hypothetical protein [Streptomyces yaizuensis]|uniref:Uncharacterized protein n=1 Tax=Streptomyces yaizuensis TaxID=2989713 RepID=A0ABQ5NXV8_9ACTN|nr:hypothetical protein [Streptomyces sp. YSPA8]GLF94988.1 hypothetical protein SYYSPA8_11845 [Streptomyces sp. YSPA8]
MGLGIRKLNRGREVVETLCDDAEDSFRAMCRRAPEHSLRYGITPYDHTMFNTPQLVRLVAELEELPDEEKTPVVRQVIDQAHQAIRLSGYLYFIGD